MASNTPEKKHENPNKHLVLPKWITAEYFESIVAKDIKEFKRIVNITPVAATQPGENYTSMMFRVFLDIELLSGTIEEVSYIVKTTLDSDGQGAAMVDGMGLFPKEKLMYETILPTFGRLYEEAGVEVSLNPRCLFIESTPERTTFVLEDLKKKNFRNVDRLKGLDMPHMRSVLRMMAELHAASVVWYELNGAYDEMFDRSLFTDETAEMFKEMGKAREKAFEAAMRKWPLDNIEYFIKAMPNMDQYVREGKILFESDPNEFNVLNHGDCWANNIMFRHNDEGELEEAVFVDFQIGKWGSPAQDLWYFIASSASLDIKVKEFDNFIFIYHERLVECLTLLGYKKSILTLKELHMKMLKYGFWGIFVGTGLLQAVLMPPDKSSNIDNLLSVGEEADDLRDRMFTNSYYVNAMCQLLPFLQKKGLLNGSE